MIFSHNVKIGLIAVTVTLLSACSTEQVVDNTFETGAFVGRTAVKGAVGASKIAYKGTSAAVTKARATQ